MSKIKTGTTLTTAYQVEGDTTGSLIIQTGSTPTTAMTIDASQNIGIGTASPVTKLTMDGNISFSGNQALNWNMYFNSGDKYMANGYAGQFYFDPFAGSMRYLNAPSNASGAGAAVTTVDRFAIDASGNLKFNSGYGSAATAYGCRAWVNFNGTGTVAIRASGNVSSITDNGTGDYTINFTSSMPDANYSVANNAIMSSQTDNNYQASLYRSASALSTGSCRMITRNSNVYNSLLDCDFVVASVFR
jgi:hypothetical protein